jgi:hypothetical protein
MTTIHGLISKGVAGGGQSRGVAADAALRRSLGLGQLVAVAMEGLCVAYIYVFFSRCGHFSFHVLGIFGTLVYVRFFPLCKWRREVPDIRARVLVEREMDRVEGKRVGRRELQESPLRGIKLFVQSYHHSLLSIESNKEIKHIHFARFLWLLWMCALCS